MTKAEGAKQGFFMLPESTSIYTNNFREAYEQMNTTKIMSLNSSLLQDGPLNQLNSVINTLITSIVPWNFLYI
jgi:hypothetical protein